MGTFPLPHFEKQADEATSVDASVYDYDAVYDSPRFVEI
jgi:hypothetical protein